jgi:hypothetical protein
MGGDSIVPTAAGTSVYPHLKYNGGAKIVIHSIVARKNVAWMRVELCR